MLLLATGACVLLLHLLGRRAAGNLVPVGPSARLVAGGLADIDALIVERGGQRIELRRTGAAWDVSQPFSAGADPVAVMRLLDALERAPVRDRFSMDELGRRALNLGDLGLAPPAARIVMSTPNQRIELQFGACLPSGREVYVCSDQAGQAVLVTDRDVFAAVPESLDQMRERTLWRESQSRVTAIELRRPGMPFVKLLRDDDGWQMAQPFSARANPAAVGRALDALRAVRIESFVWPSGTNSADGVTGGIRTRLAYYGLDGDSGVQVQLWESGNPVGVRLRFGRPVEGAPGCVYALTPGGASVVAVTNAVLTDLMASPAELRDKRLLPVAAAEMTRLTLQAADQTLTLIRATGGGWNLTTPVQGRADAAAADRLAAALADLRAERVLDADPAAVGAGVGPEYSVGVTAGVNDWRFTVTPSLAEAGCVNIVFTNAPAVFVVAATNLPAALAAPDGLLGLVDRTVLALPATTVRRLAVRRGHENWSVQRAANGEGWEAADGREPDAPAIAAWLELLAALRVDRIERLGAGARDPAAFGMREPWLEATVEVVSDDALRKVLLVGQLAGANGRFAMLRGHDVIFVLGQDALRVLERPPAK
jgi:hypothetical protein